VVTRIRKIWPSAVLFIVLAICDDTFISRVGATGSGGGGATAAAETVTWPGSLGGNSSQAYGVSSTGSVVVGYASNASGQYRAFRWTAAGGMKDLGDFGYAYGEAYGVSGDGSVVVGQAWNANDQRRVRRLCRRFGRGRIRKRSRRPAACLSVDRDDRNSVYRYSGRFREPGVWRVGGRLRRDRTVHECEQ